jgi:chromosome partitioning protein
MEPKIQFIDVATFLNITLQGVHKQIKTQKIPYYKTGNKNYLNHEGSKQLFNLKINPKIIAFELVKGGVGKTSLSFHCAIRASLYGLKCALIDLDQQANLTRAFRVDANNHPIMIDVIKDKLNISSALMKVTHGVDLLPSRFENAMLNTFLLINAIPLDRVFRQLIEPLKSSYDLIFIDCPPDLGATVTATAITSDFIMAPIEPDEFSMAGLELTLNELENISQKYDKNISIKIVLNKFNTKTNLSHQTLAALINNEKTRALVCKSFVRASQDFPNAFDKGLSIFDTLKASIAKEDIDLLTKELLEICKT